MENARKKERRYFLILAIAAVIALILANIDIALKFLGYVNNIVFPIVIGLVIAFMLNVPIRGFEKLFRRLFSKCRKKPSDKLIHTVSIILTFICALLVVALLLYAVIPALIKAVNSLVVSVEKNLPTLIAKLESSNFDTSRIRSWLSSLDLQNLISNLTGNAKNIVGSVTSIASSTVSLFSAALFGIIIAIYALLSRDTLCRQSKKLLYAYTKKPLADRISHIFTQLNAAYTKFFTVQCLEALILGVMIFLSFTLFKLPYAFLVGLVTTVCALIPYIGAFVSCALAVLLTLLVAPDKAIICLIVYLCVQLIESNLIYPYVVGGSVGLSPLWTVIAALIGGKLFGALGMVFAVPLASVIYNLIKEDSDKRLAKRLAEAEGQAPPPASDPT